MDDEARSRKPIDATRLHDRAYLTAAVQRTVFEAAELLLKVGTDESLACRERLLFLTGCMVGSLSK